MRRIFKMIFLWNSLTLAKHTQFFLAVNQFFEVGNKVAAEEFLKWL